MEKILIYATAVQGIQEAAAYNEAISYTKKGDKVLFLYCDKYIGGCHSENPVFNRNRCSICQLLFKSRMKRFLPKGVIIKSISSYMNEAIRETVQGLTFNYKSEAELRQLKYKGVQIGYGAMSSYITLTRNLNPVLKSNVVDYFNVLLKQQILLTELILKAIEEYNPDKIIFHNGRLAQYRPFIDICNNFKIPYVATETLIDSNGNALKNYFENSSPHSAWANWKKYNDFWSKFPQEIAERTGSLFFENRKNGVYAGDVVYTKRQQKGMMPVEWELGKKHIVIFNSSEDEFSAINEEVDNSALFSSQLDGIRKIAMKYENESDVQIFLRVHPNLKGIEYAYHTDLYKICGRNFFVIPPESPISSYALMDASDLVIVFGSTMGIEASYWGKPVISLAFSFYKFLNVVNMPQTEDELWGIISNYSNHKIDNKTGCLKYGFYYMSDKHERLEHMNTKIVNKSFLCRDIEVISYLTLLGSSSLYYIVDRVLKYVFGISNFTSRII